MIKIIIIINIIILIFCTFFIILLLSGISQGELFGKFTHKLFKWHSPNAKVEIHGINVVSTCKYCGKRIIKCHLDWFEDEY